jgi:hypothetical protein
MNVPTVKTRGLASCYAWAGRRAAAGVVRWRRSRAAREDQDVDDDVCARHGERVSGRGEQRHSTNRDGVGETLKRHLPHYYTSLTLASRPPRLLRSAMLMLAGVAGPSPRSSLCNSPRTTIVPRATLDADRMQREKHLPPLACSLESKKDHPAPADAGRGVL